MSNSKLTSLSFLCNNVAIAFIGFNQLIELIDGKDAGPVTTAQVGSYIGVNPTNSLSFSEAQDYCVNIIGSNGLATINSEDDNLDAILAASNSGITNDAWIGLNDIYDENNFVWIDGTLFDNYNSYSAWDINEPNDFYMGEDCVTLLINSNKWNDMPCLHSPNGFICNANPPTASPTQKPSSICDTVYDESNTVPLYRYYNEQYVNHYYKTSTGTPSGYRYEGIAGYIWKNNIEGVTVPLYRYYNEQYVNHYYKTSSGTPSGYKYEGIAGYIMAQPCEFNVPLYRFYNEQYVNHYYKTSTLSPSGYRYEGIAGYVIPP